MSPATLLNQTAFLLDVNVFRALFDPMHVHQDIVRRWYASGPHMIATCPLSELGFVRISSIPRYPNALDGPEHGLRVLRALHSDSRHVSYNPPYQA